MPMTHHPKPLNWLSALQTTPEPPVAAFSSSRAVTPEECQRAFDQARKQCPDALYAELSEIAAAHLNISASRLRKRVPNPFR
jgi:hypothetical protein